MRFVVVSIALAAAGCAGLRPSARTDPRPPNLHARAEGMVIGGTIASLVGVGLIAGGAFAWHEQTVADEQCMQQGGWFCGMFDSFDEAGFGTMIAIGVTSTVGGVALVGVGGGRLARDDAR